MTFKGLWSSVVVMAILSAMVYAAPGDKIYTIMSPKFTSYSANRALDLSRKMDKSVFTSYSTNRAAEPKGGTWGLITGTLSDQTDVNTALNDRKTLAAFDAYSTSNQTTRSNLNAAIETKQPQLSGTGFVKASGTTISYDNSTYLTTTGSAANLTNFPTLNQNTSGTAAGLSGTPNITVGTINASDLTQSGKRISGVQTHSASHTTTTPITITGKIIEVTTDNDSDTDYLYLPAGTAGQELEIIIKSMGATCTGLGVYATFADGSTNYTFPANSTGKGINLVYSGNATTGWVISGTNVLSAVNATANGTAGPGTSVIPAREDHVHPTGSTIGAVYTLASDQAVASTTTPVQVPNLQRTPIAKAPLKSVKCCNISCGLVQSTFLDNKLL